MIVPRNRLIFWTGMVAVPFAALAAAIPAQEELSLAAVGLLLVIALIDASLSSMGLQGLAVEFPPVIRLSRGREGAINFIVENKTAKTRKLRLGLAFPPELSPKGEDLLLELPKESPRSLFHWGCVPSRRGSYFFDRCYIEGKSPLGFWAVRKTVPINSEIRVYPDLLAERKHVAAMFLNRGNFGIHARRQMGQGHEFEKLREYVHGDSYEHIHWKVTAKRGHPVTKVFQIERTQEVYVVIDASRLSSRRVTMAAEYMNSAEKNGQAGKSTSVMERYVTSALIMGTAAQRQGDLFGAITFSDKIRNFIRAKGGKSHYNDCRDMLYSIQSEIVNPDFRELFSFIGMRLRKRALIIFLTSLDDPALAESFITGVNLISRRHLVMVNMLRPQGVGPLFSGGSVNEFDDIYNALGGHMIWYDLRETGRILDSRGGVRFSLLDSEKISAQLVSQYMELKERQLL